MELVMKVFNYTIIFEKGDDGGYHVYYPALKGCHSQGDSYDEALENKKDAVSLYLESLIQYLVQVVQLLFLVSSYNLLFIQSVTASFIPSVIDFIS